MFPAVSAPQSADLAPEPQAPADVAALIPMVRRIVGARVGGHPAADDLVQEILVRVLAASARIEPGMLEPYAIVTARNVIASMWRDDERDKRNRHRTSSCSERPPLSRPSSTSKVSGRSGWIAPR